MLLGRYRLIEPLGRGGMGIVWRAQDTRLGREVAVKQLRLPAELDSEQRAAWTARLDREARAAARLRHPGIVTVHDLVTGDDGQPWIIMELVDGRSLADLLAEQNTILPAYAAVLGLRILDALCVAHQAGIVHRDLKPANVLLEGERALLTDFGIAAVEGEAGLTRSGALLGTPAFMAPEQVRGESATPASDLWALGATLYTAVEGHPPFSGTTTGAILVAIATEAPSPMRNAGPLKPVVDGLLNKDPAQRPGADALHEMLTRIQATPPQPAAATIVEPPPNATVPLHDRGVPAPPTSSRSASTRRKPAVLIAAALAVVLVVSGGLLLTFALRKNSAYEANKRAAAAIGAPAGFTLKDQRKVGPNLVGRTYSGCPMFCNGSASDPSPQVAYVARWLTRVPSVADVGTPIASPDRTVWVIPVRSKTTPKIYEARVLIRQDQKDFRLQLVIG